LEEYDRCILSEDATCEEKRQIILFEGKETIKQLTGYDIQAYTTFKECFEDLKEGKRDTSQVPEEEVEKYKQLYESDEFNTAIGFIDYFEDEYECSGICSEAMFFYTLPLSDGPPSTTCLSHMKAKIKHNLTYMGIAGTLAGLIMVITWLLQYLLWKNYDD